MKVRKLIVYFLMKPVQNILTKLVLEKFMSFLKPQLEKIDIPVQISTN